MFFTINRAYFLKGLMTVNKAIANHSPHPFLQGILINVLNDHVELTGSDADLSIRVLLKDSENMKIQETGGLVLKSGLLLDIVRKFEGADVTFELIDGPLVKVHDSHSTYRIQGLSAKGYPAISFTQPDLSFDLDTGLLQDAINKTIFAVGISESRPILTGVNFSYDMNSKKGQVIATDSYRIAKKDVDISGLTQDVNITIPRKTLTELLSLLAENSQVKVAIDPQKIQFIFDTVVVQSQLLEGRYPDTSRYIPKDVNRTLVIERRPLLNALNRSFFTREDSISTVKLELEQDKIILSTNAREIGSFKESLPVISYQGEPLVIHVLQKYLIEALKSLDVSSVTFKFKGELNPFVVVSEEEADVLNLILPTRTHD